MDTAPSSGTQTPSSTVSSTTTATTTSTTSQSEPTSQTTGKTRLDFSRLQTLFSTSSTPSKPSAQSPLWYILTTAVLLSFHKEKLVGDLWTFLAGSLEPDQRDEDLLAIARRIREACLKASTLVGFPRVSIEAHFPSLAAWHLPLILPTNISRQSTLSSPSKPPSTQTTRHSPRPSRPTHLYALHSIHPQSTNAACPSSARSTRNTPHAC